MNGPSELHRLLATDPRDAGCDATFAVIDVCAEMVLDRADAARRYPEVAIHLSHCPSCSQDLQGILALADCAPPEPG